MSALSPFVFADEVTNPFSPACQYTYHKDSFGRGIKAFVLKADARVDTSLDQNWDEGCYLLGQDWAKRTLADVDSMESCVSEFGEGRAEGLAAGNSTDGDSCFGLGLSAGAADRDIGAREWDQDLVGKDCVDAYTQGWETERKGGSDEGYDIEGDKLKACYGMGYFDGPLNRPKRPEGF